MSTTHANPDLLGQSTDGRSSGLTLNLSSNNPFRNRAASPSSFSPPPHSPFDDPPPRPSSRNPFLDPSATTSSSNQLIDTSDRMASPRNRASPTAEELFDNLIIDDGDGRKPAARPAPGRPMNRPPGGGPPGRGDNIAARGRGPPPSSSHRPTRSQEEALRARRMPSGPVGERGSASPNKHSERRPRRNSESSMMEKPMSEEEKRMREMRRRDRERRHREGKDKPKGRKLDIIDQLDATSIYGTGLFHHDGPFDACNPHRNRKGSRRAPMQAFAKDSANNSIGGAGPINARPDHKVFLAQEPHEATSMYAAGHKEKDPAKAEMAFFDPKQRGEYVHTEESLGLGSSTFLEGTPAARTAIQRNQEETAQQTLEQGLGRKKSVVQRFRSIKRGPRADYGEGHITSPSYGPRTGDMPTANSTGERNPFFNEYDKTEERISVRRKDSNPMSPVSPPGQPSLERRVTADATMDSAPAGDSKAGGGGFMSRMKSLKGGRRQPRPEMNREPSGQIPAGTAM